MQATLFLVLLIVSPIFASLTETLELGETQTLTAPEAALNFESFGPATLTLSASAKALTIEGPFTAPNYADLVPIGSGPVLKTFSATDGEENLTATVELTAAAVYRIIPKFEPQTGARTASESSRITIKSQCAGACWRKAWKPRELVRHLEERQLLTPLVDAINQRLAEVFAVAPSAAQSFQLALRSLVSSDKNDTFARFPMVPAFHKFANTARPLLHDPKAGEPVKSGRISGVDLFDYLGPCTVDRTQLPPEVSPEKLPGLRYGHYLDQSLSACTIAHSQKVADLLTTLAVNSGESFVRFSGRHDHYDLRTPEDFFRALAKEGHHVQLRNERTYANFLAFALDGMDSEWPVWFETGIRVGGAPVAIPMGHSQFAWRISGPRLNARVAFFLGMNGVGFFPMTDKRPRWTGDRALTRVASDAPQAEQIYIAAKFARQFALQNMVERKGLRADGYGLLGVCNDSNAVLEYATQGTVSSYPMLRDKSLDTEAAHAGFGSAELAAIMRQLPHDGDLTDADLAHPVIRTEIVARMLRMNPHDLKTGVFPDALLREQLRELSGM